MPKPQDVANYYDEWNEQYSSVYGDIIQAFRPSDTKQLLEYTLESMGIKNGMKLIDAGCGFAGPARFFASKLDVQIDALTVSPAQVTEANNRIAKDKLENRILVHEGDYHQLSSYYPAQSYDGVYFLESLGHGNDLDKVISEVYQVLKPMGFVYIKDFFFKETNDPAFNEKVQGVVKKVNEDYCYNVMDLPILIKTLRTYGFIIEFIKAPKFADDIAIRKEFEVKNGIDTFGGNQEFYYAEWLEIKCIKFPY